MAEIWDIEEHLAEHPEDDAARWSLAKRYFAAAEYRKALDHLETLRRQRTLRINEMRYLGATLYRLGRFSEAEQVLKEAIGHWPEEIQLYEQLSRVQEAAGFHEAALETWRQIMARQPDHPLGERAVRRLKKKLDQDQKQKASRSRRLFTTTLETRNCPQCGVINTEIAARCWQCGARLHTPAPGDGSDTDTEEETPLPGSTDSRAVPPEIASSMLMLLSGGLALVCVILVVLVFGPWWRDDSQWIPLSVAEVFQWRSQGGRIAMYLTLLAGWPLALRAGMKVFSQRPRFLPMGIVYLMGVALAELFCVISFIPGPGLLLGCLITAVFSLMGVVLLLELPLISALGVWVIHIIPVILLGAGSFFLAESYLVGEWLSPYRETAAIVRHAREGAAYNTLAGTTPLESQVTWDSTGSEWLDRRAPEVRLTVLCEKPAKNTSLQIYDESGAKLFDYVQGQQHVSRFQPVPGRPYRVVVGGDAGIRFSLVMESMFGVSLEQKKMPAEP
ncbi:MAG TPA: tetratricopeptide repeat protein [Candidatus Hydrogenedentes bacterium]|nr:tetratricopeptide repeat protein [Candidatus Hydrogenedentota bacterium]